MEHNSQNMVRISFVILFFIASFSIGFGQKKITELPKEVAESSALLKVDDIFLTINDSGNKPIVFSFNSKGKITHQCLIENVKNIDWEAMTYDGKYLYIGDIGNNENKRKELTILKVNMDDVLTKDKATAEKIHFHYPEQQQFPPKNSELYYDAEALFHMNNELIIVTKNRTQPFDGIAKLYKIPSTAGNHSAKLFGEIKLPPTHWIENSVTDAYFYNNEELFLLTYSYIYKFEWKDNQFVKTSEFELDTISQKEGIYVDERYIYLTDENDFKFFKTNYLYQLKKF